MFVFALDQYALQEYRNLIFSSFVSETCEIPIIKIENNFRKCKQRFILICEEKLFVVSSLFTLSIAADSKHQVSHLISGLALLWVLSDLMNGFNL